MKSGRTLLLSAIAAGITALYAGEASARSFRVNDLPNGNKYQCLDCHTSNSGHSDTAFGTDSRNHLTGSGSTSTKHVDWASLCPLDSDGDGYTNGQELGDPNCTWTRGQPNPGGPTSNPGKASSVPASACGDHIRQSGEQCDGSDLGGATCSSLGAGDGTVSCTSACKLDTSACSQGSGTVPDPTTGSGGGAGGDGAGGDAGFSGSSTPKSSEPPPVLPIGCSTANGASGEGAAFGAALAVGLGLVFSVRRKR